MEQPTTLTELVATVTATILNEIAPTATVTVTAAAAATPSVLEKGYNLYTTPVFLTSFWINGAIACAEFLAWIVFRRLIKAVYEPRTYIPLREQQAAPLGAHLFKPLLNIWKTDPEDILDKNGVDPYVFVRFLRLLSRALVPIWIVSWIVLLPINATNGNGETLLDKFTFRNVKERSKFWAHLTLAWVFNGWIMFLLWHEMKEWLVIRQKYLVSKKHSRTAQASTILVTGIPKQYMDEVALAKLFELLPGGVKRVWLMRDLVHLPDLWKRRLAACATLEQAQVALIHRAHERQDKINSKIAWYENKGKPVPEHLRAPANPEEKHMSAADRYVPRKDRPTIRLGPAWAPFSLGFLGIGTKVDAIEWARSEIAQCTAQLDASRDQLARDILTPGVDKEYYAPLSSAFIRFNQQIAAHMAHQCLTYNEPYRMSCRYIEQSPENVLWQNMSMRSQYELSLRKTFSYLVTGGLIVAFAFPAGYASVMSRLLVDRWDALKDEDKLWIMAVKGILTGVVPPVLLAVILLLAPILLRMLAQIHRVSRTEVELDVMNRYFVFLLINRFLIVTVVGVGAGASVNFSQYFKTNDWVGTFRDTFTNELPRASNFFIILVMVQFTGTLFVLLQPVSLVLYYLRVTLGGGTPRKVYNSRYSMTYVEWGSEFPNVTIYFVIMMTYMIISPVINGLGACFSIMSYFVYKYLCLWVLEQKPQMDTGGAFFPKAVTHVFVGLYLQEITLMLLFFTQDKQQGLPQGVLMIILILVTITVHYMLYASYSPLIDSLPLSLAHLTYGSTAESRAPKPIVHDPHFSIISDVDEKKETVYVENVSLEPEEYLSNPYDTTPNSNSTERPASTSSSVTATSRDSQHKRYDSTYDWRDVYWCERTHRWELKTSASPTDAKLASPTSSDETQVDTEAADDDDDDMEKTYFAKPGGAGVVSYTRDDANDPAAFFHPATKDEQPTIWLPKDEFGIGTEEAAANAAMGVRSTTKNAIFDHKGRVKVLGPAPEFVAVSKPNLDAKFVYSGI